MSLVDEINKLFSVPEDNRIIRMRQDANGNEVVEIIPTSALREYNQLLEKIHKKGIRSVNEIKALTKKLWLFEQIQHLSGKPHFSGKADLNTILKYNLPLLM